MTNSLTIFVVTVINTIFRFAKLRLFIRQVGDRKPKQNKQQPNTMKNVKLNLKKTAKAGFSLVEMLVVIAVIGVIAAIAIPNIGNINESALDSTAQRNAQSCASVYSSGLAAGCAAASSEADALSKLASGTWAPTVGAFAGKVFQVPNLPTSGEDYDRMITHLDFDTSTNYLNYTK